MFRLAYGDRLVIATHNPGKLAEIRELLAPRGIQTVSSGELGLPEPEENATSFAGNARLKALTAAKAAGLPALADDSGFCVAALGGRPGLLSARWAAPGRNFAPAMQKIRDLTAMQTDGRAWFICALCLAWPDASTQTYQGRVDGSLCWPPRGAHGFGYDPIFIPAGQTRSYGEMTTAEKETDSHRARAFEQLARGVLPHAS